MELDGLADELGEVEALDEGDTEELGLSDREALAEGDTDELGETELLGLIDVLADGLLEEDGDMLVLAEGEVEKDGEVEALGERETEKLCMEISQFSLVNPVTTLNSSIAPKTLPNGWGPYLTIEGLGRTVPSWVR
jgi:hypothetical protein